MRFRGNFHDKLRIFLAVFPFCGFGRMHRGSNEKTSARGDILKNYLSIRVRMDILFHSADDSTGLEFLEGEEGKTRVSLYFVGREKHGFFILSSVPMMRASQKIASK